MNCILPRRFLLVLVTLISYGYVDGQNVDIELTLDSNVKQIKREVDGFIFTFCLLNKDGVPQTSFKEGENFCFYFSIKNNFSEFLFFVPSFAQSNSNSFCKVFDSRGFDKGKPYVYTNSYAIGLGAYSFKLDSSCVFKQVWMDDRLDDWVWKYGTYRSLHKKQLPKGNYYTEFNSPVAFVTSSGKKHLSIDNVRFKINFEVL